ncbi:MAG: VWA domain-containing protein, partial [Chloroflexota bacterium]
PVDAASTDIDAAHERLRELLAPSVKSEKPGAIAQQEQIDQAHALLQSMTERTRFDRANKSKSSDAYFTTRLTPSKRVAEKLTEAQVVYLLVDIIPKVKSGETPTRRDAGLNLTLVLDHSNSMNGVRLNKVKVAATEIIEQLGNNDVLSVVTFNDRAEVVIPATLVQEKKKMISRTRMMRAMGGTELFQGLKAGIAENRKNASPDRVNHVIVLTDGHTFGDHDKCLSLSRQVSQEGISISTLGLGAEWNDEFLDEIASMTGGSSGFIKSANAVVSFLNSQVQSLSNIYTERVQLTIAPAADIDIEMAFKLAPSPQPLPAEDNIINLGGMQFERPISVLLQLQIPANAKVGAKPLVRTVVNGNVMVNNRIHTEVRDIAIEISEDPTYEDPPNRILDALGKLTLYRMQERANEAIEAGNVRQATTRLQNLATRLLETGHEELAQEAFQEVKRLEQTHSLSEEGRKNLKYQTRLLIAEDES